MRGSRGLTAAAGGVALALVAVVARGEGEGAVDRGEPRLELYLEVDGREEPIELDRRVELPAPGGKLTLVVRARPWRQLTLPALRLRYPRAYHFEHDRDEHLESWTLSGADAKLMLFHLAQSPDADAAQVAKLFAASTREQYGAQATAEAAPPLALGGAKLPGERIRAALAGSITIVQDVHARVHADGSCTVFVLQHSPTEAGEEPAESRLLRQQLIESLTWR
jgi:hypothetical protein